MIVGGSSAGSALAADPANRVLVLEEGWPDWAAKRVETALPSRIARMGADQMAVASGARSAWTASAGGRWRCAGDDDRGEGRHVIIGNTPLAAEHAPFYRHEPQVAVPESG